MATRRFSFFVEWIVGLIPRTYPIGNRHPTSKTYLKREFFTVESTLAVLPDSFVRPSDFLLPGGEWFVGAGFGLFVHWDHASQQGIEISWPLVGRSILPGVDAAEDPVTVEQYHSSAPSFNPVEWDAVALAKLAKRAGA